MAVLDSKSDPVHFLATRDPGSLRYDAPRPERPRDPANPASSSAAATVGGAVKCRGRPVAPGRRSFVIRCGLLHRRGQGEADRLCEPDGGSLRARILQPLQPAGRALRPPQDGRPLPPARLLAGPDPGRRRLRSVLRGLPAHQRPTTSARAACSIPSHFPLAGAA